MVKMCVFHSLCKSKHLNNFTQIVFTYMLMSNFVNPTCNVIPLHYLFYCDSCHFWNHGVNFVCLFFYPAAPDTQGFCDVFISRQIVMKMESTASGKGLIKD